MAPAAAQRRLIAVAGLLFVVVVVAVVVTGRRAHRSQERLLAPLPAAGVDYCQAELETGYGVGGNGTKLAMAIVIARHGDRAPVDLLPNEDDVSWSGCGRYRMDLIADGSEDAFAGFNYSSPPSGNPYAHGMWTGECTAGQLTSKGAQQLAVLGARLKARWIDRLSLTTAIPGALNLSLRSTDIPRARESAEYLIGTLLPRGISGADAITLTRRPFAVEDMVGNPRLCPRFAQRKQELLSSPKWIAREKARQHFRRTLAYLLDTRYLADWGKSPSIDRFFDTLRARSCHKKRLPCAPELWTLEDCNATSGRWGWNMRTHMHTCCVTQEIARQVFSEGDWEYGTLYSDLEFSRLSVGAFLYELYLDLAAANVGQPPYRIGVRVGHDTTIAPILGVLGAPALYWVPYASHIEVELWQHQENRSLSEVHVFFNGRSLYVPQCSGRREHVQSGDSDAQRDAASKRRGLTRRGVASAQGLASDTRTSNRDKAPGPTGHTNSRDRDGILHFCTLSEFEALVAAGKPSSFTAACEARTTVQPQTSHWMAWVSLLLLGTFIGAYVAHMNGHEFIKYGDRVYTGARVCIERLCAYVDALQTPWKRGVSSADGDVKQSV